MPQISIPVLAYATQGRYPSGSCSHSPKHRFSSSDLSVGVMAVLGATFTSAYIYGAELYGNVVCM